MVDIEVNESFTETGPEHLNVRRMAPKGVMDHGEVGYPIECCEVDGHAEVASIVCVYPVRADAVTLTTTVQLRVVLLVQR